jgi:hypothetical protein
LVFQFSGKFQFVYVFGFQIQKTEFRTGWRTLQRNFQVFLKHPLKFFFPIRSGLDKKADELMSNTKSAKPEEE